MRLVVTSTDANVTTREAAMATAHYKKIWTIYVLVSEYQRMA